MRLSCWGLLGVRLESVTNRSFDWFVVWWGVVVIRWLLRSDVSFLVREWDLLFP